MIRIFLLHRLHLLCCFISICECCSSVFQSPFSLVFPLVFLLCFYYDMYFLTTSITPFVLFYKYLCMLFFLSFSLLVFPLVCPLVFLLCFYYDAYFLTTSITPFVLFYKYLCMLFFCLSVSLLAGFPISILTLFFLWCVFSYYIDYTFCAVL